MAFGPEFASARWGQLRSAFPTTGSFNTASQLTSTTITGAGAGTGVYTYDGLGRTTTVPAIDTNNPGGDNLGLGFYSTDKVASQTVGAS